jgi:hypothetical protein
MSDIEGKAARGSSERMEPLGGGRHRWENREVEWEGAHESMRAASEFQTLKRYIGQRRFLPINAESRNCR